MYITVIEKTGIEGYVCKNLYDRDIVRYNEYDDRDKYEKIFNVIKSENNDRDRR